MSAETTTAVVYAPLLLPIEHLEPGMTELQRKAATELVGLSGKLGIVSDFTTTAGPLAITYAENASSFPAFASAWRHPGNIREYHFIRFEVSDDFQLDAWLPHERSEEHARYAACDSLERALAKTIGDIVVAAQIAYPGSLEITGLFTLSGGAIQSLGDGFRSSMAFAVEEAARLEWPPVLSLTIAEVWEWMLKIPGLTRGVPSGPSGRAVSALSHLLTSRGGFRQSVEDLVWSLVGLEALYAKGNVGMTAQLLEKSEVLLGPRTVHKRSFSKMYEFRSQFVHGSIDFPLAYSPYDAVDEFERYSESSYGSFLLASITLIASLQRLVKRGEHSLDFRYALE